MGDYLLSKGLLLSLDNKDHRVLQLLSTAVRLMSEGELLQLEKSRKLNLDESIYYEIIGGKTASLLASSCAAGASTTFDNDDAIEKMRLFGEKVGMAFQIKDDLFDYSSEAVGKPTGNDIKEKKLLAQDQIEILKITPPTPIIYIREEPNLVNLRMKFQLDGNPHLGTNNEQIHLLQHNQVE